MVRLRTQEDDYTFISERTLTGSGFATSPELISGIVDLQRRTIDQTSDSAEIGAAAEAAQGAADAAQGAASGAQTSADTAQARADAAYNRADAAYALADTKVTQDAGPSFAAPSGALSRSALPSYAGGTAAATYTQADMQAAIDQIAALSSRLAAVIVDLRGNGALTG